MKDQENINVVVKENIVEMNKVRISAYGVTVGYQILKSDKPDVFNVEANIRYILKDYLGNKLYHKDGVYEISYRIQRYFEHMMSISQSIREDQRYRSIKHFIRILKYGHDFNCVVMVRDGEKEYNIYYRDEEV